MTRIELQCLEIIGNGILRLAALDENIAESVRNRVKNQVAVVLMTIVLAGIYYTAGTCVIFAGCSSVTRMKF